MRILHLSADYPDPLAPAKTNAVANLLALAGDHEHRVTSLNRIGWRAGIHALHFDDRAGRGHRAVAYGAPRFGLFHERYLREVAAWIAADTELAEFRSDIVHAHKLTVEGIVGSELARRWNVPLAVSVQGNTDLKIARAKRSLRPLFARIWREEAAVAFPFAPWARAALDALLGERPGPTHCLPVPGPADSIRCPAPADGPLVVSAFHFRDATNKNAAGLIRAIAMAANKIPGIRLKILGGGDPGAFAQLAALAEEVAPGRVRFLGAVPQSEVQELFHRAACFALVSHRESYGMVFAEALLAGTPCLIPRGRAIDGYFEEGTVLLAAEPSNTDEIAAGLVRLIREEAGFKSRLDGLGAAGGLDFLRRATIGETYSVALGRLPKTFSSPLSSCSS